MLQRLRLRLTVCRATPAVSRTAVGILCPSFRRKEKGIGRSRCALNTLAYLVFLLSLSKVQHMLGRANAIAFMLIVSLSFAHFAVETFKKYPVNCAWLMIVLLLSRTLFDKDKAVSLNLE